MIVLFSAIVSDTSRVLEVGSITRYSLMAMAAMEVAGGEVLIAEQR